MCSDDSGLGAYVPNIEMTYWRFFRCRPCGHQGKGMTQFLSLDIKGALLLEPPGMVFIGRVSAFCWGPPPSSSLGDNMGPRPDGSGQR